MLAGVGLGPIKHNPLAREDQALAVREVKTVRQELLEPQTQAGVVVEVEQIHQGRLEETAAQAALELLSSSIPTLTPYSTLRVD